METTKLERPTRVVLNFTHRCALLCEWCYVPFGSEKARKEIVLDIVQRVADLGFESITFGGGDPFQYSFISSLLRRASELGLNVHVDTHGKSLYQTSANADLLNDSVRIIGLPIDGPSAALHDSVRGMLGHFDLVLMRIEWLRNLRPDIKINTMVSHKNIYELLAIAKLIVKLSPARWSIYQYWPLGPAMRVSDAHAVRSEDFMSLGEDSKKYVESMAFTSVEVNEQLVRKATYPIIHHDGSVFVHSAIDANSFEFVCSIFDILAREKIDYVCGAERLIAESRYRSEK